MIKYAIDVKTNREPFLNYLELLSNFFALVRKSLDWLRIDQSYCASVFGFFNDVIECILIKIIDFAQFRRSIESLTFSNIYNMIWVEDKLAEICEKVGVFEVFGDFERVC